MLSPAPPPPGSERPIGELVSGLVDEGKAYARAELNLARVIAADKAKALAIPAALFGVALFVAMAALNALAVGVVIALAKFIGPLAAGFVGMLLFFAIAGALAWVAVGKVRQAL